MNIAEAVPAAEDKILAAVMVAVMEAVITATVATTTEMAAAITAIIIIVITAIITIAIIIATRVLKSVLNNKAYYTLQILNPLKAGLIFVVAYIKAYEAINKKHQKEINASYKKHAFTNHQTIRL